MKKTQLQFVTLALVVTIAGCSQVEQNGTQSETTSQNESDKTLKGQASVKDDLSAKNILQIAAGSSDHSTLVAAVQAAGIEHVLANNGPLTVFAPNNAAFEKLPKGTVEELLKPENNAKLRRIITFHASPGTYKTDMLKDGLDLYQATGDYIKISNKDGVILVNGAKIIATIEASNGVIHVIDSVLLPPDKK